MNDSLVANSYAENLKTGLQLLARTRDAATNLLEEIRKSSTIFPDSVDIDTHIDRLSNETILIAENIKELQDKLISVSDENGNTTAENVGTSSNNISESVTTEVCKNYLTKGFCIDLECSLRHFSIPEKKVSLNEYEHSEEKMEAYEEPTEDYKPTDESRICKFFIRDGKCWKNVCRYEHTKTFKWTHDMLDVYSCPFNCTVLPTVGTVLDLAVTGIESLVTLYCHLPKEYSDIGEGIDHFETLADLEKDMNSKEAVAQYSALPVDPAEGETVIVKINRSWYRATVISQDGSQVTVFLVDYGKTDIVNLNDLRVVIPRFMYLPFQAIACQLHGISYNEESPLPLSELRYLGISYLSEHFLHQTITANVKYVDNNNECIHISAIFNGVDIAQDLVDKGFCSKF